MTAAGSGGAAVADLTGCGGGAVVAAGGDPMATGAPGLVGPPVPVGVADGITTSTPHFEQAPRLPARRADTLMRWPLGQWKEITDPASGRAAPAFPSAFLPAAIGTLLPRTVPQPPFGTGTAVTQVYQPLPRRRRPPPS
jgi:hypothetical protein